jgi:biotin-(acetyl-CoA carboxylase) ligase
MRGAAGRGIVIVGIGLNVDYLPGELDFSAKLPPTSLLVEEGKIWNLQELLEGLLRQLAERGDRTRAEWMGEYRENLAFVGEVVRVSGPYVLLDEHGERREFEAVLRGVDDEGNLLLEAAGKLLRLASGDILAT